MSERQHCVGCGKELPVDCLCPECTDKKIHKIVGNIKR